MLSDPLVFTLAASKLPLFAIFLFIAGFIFSIGFHEFSHAISAHMLGDDTPKYQGRLTLNPIVHLDLIGTIVMFFSPIPFGWGKPVEVNPQNMGMHPEKKYFLTSIAGPLSNILLATILFFIIWGYISIIKGSISFLGLSVLDTFALLSVLKSLFTLNIVLALFNLIPISPLDGSKIWGVALPYDVRMRIEPFLKQYGLIILFALILPIFPNGSGTQSFISLILSPIVSNIESFFFGFIV